MYVCLDQVGCELENRRLDCTRPVAPWRHLRESFGGLPAAPQPEREEAENCLGIGRDRGAGRIERIERCGDMIASVLLPTQPGFHPAEADKRPFQPRVAGKSKLRR